MNFDILDEKMEITKYAPNVCDVRDRRCWRVEVHGNGFYEEDDIKADYTVTKVTYYTRKYVTTR